MPKNDTWPGSVAVESLSNMDSAGSCDSVISINSTCSEDSMEHLSAEERACLMYLEETIEALEVQEDSGLSNDESDPGVQTQRIAWRVNDISIFNSESGRAEHHVVNRVSEPQSYTVLAANGKDAISTSLDLAKQKPSVSESVTHSKATSSGDQAKMLCISVDGDGHPKIVTTPTTHRINPGQSTEVPEIDLGLIPPPSDFMDDPCPSAQPEKVKDLHPPSGKSTNKPGAPIDLEQLRQRASVKRTPVSSSVTQEDPPKVSLSLNQPALTSGLQMGPPPEAAELRGPPVVAPKPKKLPANIFLKSHKVSTGSESNSGNSIPTNDRVLLDPQRVRIEALRKLGLIKSVETDSDPSLSPKHSPKDRRSWPAPSSPVIPGAPHTPPLTPSSVCVNTPPPASVSSQAPAAVSVNSTAPPVQFSSDILPAPAAFSDPAEPLVFNNKLSAVKDVSEAKVNALVNTPPLTPPALTKQLAPFKITGFKSATLERSGPDLSSHMAAQDSSEASQGVRGEEKLSQLRNSRPRPASLGSRKEFSSAQGEDLQARGSSKEPDLRRSLPAQTASQQSRDSQKLSRSQGISVLISPRAENGEDRRKALKKLGLLRD